MKSRILNSIYEISYTCTMHVQRFLIRLVAQMFKTCKDFHFLVLKMKEL